MIQILFLIISIVLGLIMQIAFGRYDWGIYKRGALIYRHQKVTRFLIRFFVAIFFAYIAPGYFVKNLLSIGFTFWFFFDAYMGYKIKRNIMYTGTESLLDDLGDSSKLYFWGKFFAMLGTYMYYFL
jgi:hypothetical protein